MIKRILISPPRSSYQNRQQSTSSKWKSACHLSTSSWCLSNAGGDQIYRKASYPTTKMTSATTNRMLMDVKHHLSGVSMLYVMLILLLMALNIMNDHQHQWIPTVNAQQDYSDHQPSSTQSKHYAHANRRLFSSFYGKKCTQYGHSCLGGHGKRSLGISTLDSTNNKMQQLMQQLQQEKHAKPLSVPLYVYRGSTASTLSPSSPSTNEPPFQSPVQPPPIRTSVEDLLFGDDYNSPVAVGASSGAGRSRGSFMGHNSGPMFAINPLPKAPLMDNSEILKMLSMMVDPARMQHLNAYIEQLKSARKSNNINNNNGQIQSRDLTGINSNSAEQSFKSALLDHLRFINNQQQQQVSHQV